MDERAARVVHASHEAAALLLAGASKPPWRPVSLGSGTGSPPRAEICYNLNTMTDPPNHLKLVDSQTIPPDDAEFIPLPYYPWEKRPSHLPLGC